MEVCFGMKRAQFEERSIGGSGVSQSFELLERLHDGSVVLSPSYSEHEDIEDLKNTCKRALVMDFCISSSAAAPAL
jgi:hypothetical protein